MNPNEEHPLNALSEQASAEERKKQVYTQKALRTFEGDIQEAVEKRNASTASMVIAEQAKTVPSSLEQKRPPSNLWKKLLISIASILLICIGVGGGLYIYLKSPLAPSAPAVPAPAGIPSIIPTDSQKTLDVSGLGSDAARAAVESALSSTANGNGSILQIVPVEKTTAGTESMLDASDFLSLLALPAPDILSRSLNGQWMLGTYDDGGTAAPFMILTDDFFQNAYAGMITWESTMPDDLSNVFGYADKTSEESGTSTIASYFTIQGSFKDGVIENKDVRLFTAANGAALVLYSFVDNDTIVITTDENALAGIINRLEKQTFTR
jgi:hypothetical protein